MGKISEARSALDRCLANLDMSILHEEDTRRLLERLDQHFEKLYILLFDIYGHRYDFHYQLEKLIITLQQGLSNRSEKLKVMDRERQENPDWFLQENMLGMSVYVDLFAGNLHKLIARIPYLQSLGITYLHLMPLYDSPEGESDGGYAVSDYRKVNPALGTMGDLVELGNALRDAGISLVLDFVFNHTSDEHEWAKLAKAGDKKHQGFYWMFDNRLLPDQYEHTLREIFPQIRRGSFTFNEQTQKWVWTTFNSFQWDLNYSNPAVFNAIAGEMLFLANVGCEALRLDALAFIWKEMGTNCENQPKAHGLIQAFNVCLQIVAPAVVFKSEAIVHPDEVLKYIDTDECQLSYNPLLMALLWESLATRQTRLLTESMRKSFDIDPQCAWVNYVRCHDDIGWTFDDTVARKNGMDGYDHRHFLNQFYTGRFEGSFAKGVPFQENPNTGDCRVCGTAASLAGLEIAQENQDPEYIEHSVRRVLMIHSIVLSIGGIPLLYAGDELGLLNDYRYSQDQHKQKDARWVHRIPFSEQVLAGAQEPTTAQYAIAKGLEKMIGVRKQTPILGQSRTQILESDNPHIFVYVRIGESERLMAICNFSEHQQMMDGRIMDHLSSAKSRDLLSEEVFHTGAKTITLAPYQVMWLLTLSPKKP